MPRILIVDDEKAILVLLSAAFCGAGYKVTTATSGEQALHICQTDRFDVVLSDLKLSGIDGHQTVSRIRADTPEVVSVVMSGFEVDYLNSCCRVLARHSTLLQKPFAPGLAVSTIGELLAAKRTSVLS